VAKKLPPDVLEFFRKQGARGGKLGRGRVFETMTPEQRQARARKAGLAAAAKREAKAKGNAT
jgi:hypothetical protein